MKPFLRLIMVLVTVTCGTNNTPNETTQLIMIITHGLEYPKKNDDSNTKNDVNKYNDSLSDKLSGNGFRMSYLLGKYLFSQFKPFLSKKPQHLSKWKVNSSHKAKSVVTAQSFNLGFFEDIEIDKNYSKPDFLSTIPFENAKTIDNSDIKTTLPYGYYPYPLLIEDQENDFKFNPHESNICKYLNSNFQQIERTSHYLKIKKELNTLRVKYKNFDKMISDEINIETVKTLDHYYMIINYVYSMEKLGKNFEGFTFKNISFLFTAYKDFLNELLDQDKNYKKLFLSGLVNSMIKDFNKNDSLKTSVYVGNHINILVFLHWISDKEFFDSLTFDQLKAASLVFEKYSLDGEEFISK